MQNEKTRKKNDYENRDTKTRALNFYSTISTVFIFMNFRNSQPLGKISPI